MNDCTFNTGYLYCTAMSSSHFSFLSYALYKVIWLQLNISFNSHQEYILCHCKKTMSFGWFRYLQPPSEWITCSLESRELLSLCLKKLKGLNRVKLVDAGFVWTEPHSKRIKVCCYIQYLKLVASLLFYISIFISETCQSFLNYELDSWDLRILFCQNGIGANPRPYPVNNGDFLWQTS